MKLRGIEFGNILGASGVQGFFGEGYWFHKLLKPFGLNFDGMTFVSKTATLFLREGNTSLTRNYTLKNPFPGCVKVKFRRGAMLNAFGLSNPGISILLGRGRWQKRKKPFFISLMPVTDTPQQRLCEIEVMMDIIRRYRRNFSAPFGLQINLSCPNTRHKPSELIKESARILDVANALGVPLMPKYSIASAPIQAIMELNSHLACDAICVSNTLPFGWEGIDWKRAWGSTKSPLAKFGGGGLSGQTLLPLVTGWIYKLRDAGFTKPINGGGGIFSEEDVLLYQDSGASSVFIGSVATLRPWQVEKIINFANNLEWEETWKP